MSEMQHRDTATLAGGCFGCLEAVFRRVKGVERVDSGYTGGTVENPTYQQVCSGGTGHAEAVRIVFDPMQVSYRNLLEVFFAIHDPTTLNRQGNDAGTQYRSAIYFHSPGQEAAARAFIQELNSSGAWPDPVVTEVAPAGAFYLAEQYHQEYFERNGYQPYCQFVVAPKVRKFHQKFSSLERAGMG